MVRQASQAMRYNYCSLLKFTLVLNHVWLFEWIYSANNFVPVDLYPVFEMNDIVKFFIQVLFYKQNFLINSYC